MALHWLRGSGKIQALSQITKRDSVRRDGRESRYSLKYDLRG